MNPTPIDTPPELLRAVLDQLGTPVYAARAIRDDATNQILDFRFTVTNGAFRAWGRYTQEGLHRATMRTLVPSFPHLSLFDHYVRVVETREPYQRDVLFPGPNGPIWLDISAAFLADGIVVSFTDITERRQAEEQLQQANNALQGTLDASLSSILAMTALRNEQGQIVDFSMDRANQSVVRSLGKTPAELEGKTLLSVYPGNVESGFFALYAKAADTGIPQQTTLHYTDVNGYQGWFEVSAVRHAPDQIVLTFMNVTEYKQTELLVRQQADLVQSVLDATMNPVVTYQAVRDTSNRIVDFRFTLANQAALAVVNMSAEELYARTLLEVSPDLRNSAVFDDYVTVVQTGQPITLERYRQGRWFLANAVRFGEGSLLTSSVDITSQKQAQLQIERLNEQLQRSNASLDQFAAIASHDLQEPLRKIKSFGDILLDQYAPNLGDGVSLLQRMQSAAERMQTLIRDLLTYSRLSQEQPGAHQPVDLNHLVNEVINDLEVAIKEKGAVLEIGHLPTLHGDPLQLRQVFQNVLSNALKFTKPGRIPTLVLTARRLEGAELPDEVNLATGFYWQITVADNGIGFSEKYRNQIFGAFERLHSKTSVYGGTGIGLAIVRKVMENHRGAVTAHSMEDKGATFALFFPVDDK